MKLDSLNLLNTISFSSPEPEIKENAVAPAKETAIAKTESLNASTTIAKTNNNSVKLNQETDTKEAAPPEIQEKEAAAVKVQQQVSSEIGKNKTYTIAPNTIISGPAITIAKTESINASTTIAKTNNNSANLNQETAGKEAAPPEIQEKQAAAVKVQQPVSSEIGKNKTYTIAPNAIISGPAVTIEQKVNTAAADILQRKIDVIRSIYFKSDSLVLILYDNGIVDGDTVSVVLNDEVIIPKQGLSEKAYRKVIRTTPDVGDSLRLVMYAENLGSIPPNTGLLIVEDGEDRYDIMFEGDLKRNSAVILRRKK
jgi:hypothetical protein